MSTRKRRERAGDTGSPSTAGFIALVRLSTKDNRTLADAGASCAQVPDESLAHLQLHDPPQVIPADAFAKLSPEHRTWLIDRTGKNLPWLAIADTLDLELQIGLAEAGLLMRTEEA